MSVHTMITVAPSTLLVDKNIREAKLSKAFIENVRELGVLQPPIVHQSEEGLRVVMGHRRTLAAVEAELAEIPVLLADTVEEADRLAQQVSENDVREGLSDAERGAAFEQMALLGVTPAQIAKRTGTGDTETVKRALAAKKDPKAAEALNAGYTFEEALALAEFAADADAVAQLEETIEETPDQLAHVLQQLRDERELEEKKDAAAAPYVERGMTRVEKMGSIPAYYDALLLSSLADAEGNHPTEDDANAVYVRLWDLDSEPTIELGILGWEETRFKSTYGTTGNAARGPMTEEQKEERRTLIANNKAADSAQVVRREWVTALLARKSAPKGWQRFLALANTVYFNTVRDHSDTLAADLLGIPDGETTYSRYPALTRLDQHVTDNPARPEMTLLAIAFAGFENNLRRDTWRETRPVAARFYLNQLETWGYTLSEVEKIITTTAEKSTNTDDQTEE